MTMPMQRRRSHNSPRYIEPVSSPNCSAEGWLAIDDAISCIDQFRAASRNLSPLMVGLWREVWRCIHQSPELARPALQARLYAPLHWA